ncbi:MAG: class F420-dependent oxidoreductase, partial [Solirubrobacterales bacterium]|nr:class F420-dependent oxidoreductase [Solirubrobacterales bacterium]
MATIGYFLACEEHGAPDLVAISRRAEEAGFRAAWISDHYHPWNDEQGESPHVWTALGAIAAATRELRVTTAVTCPTVRIHPAVVAQAAATTATLLPGRFGLGVGSGEALNEHILGAVWPEAEVRLEMLEEAVAVIRLLWQGGFQSHHGRHYTIENARIYSLPDELPPILVSAFGPKAVDSAARIGDGFMSVQPDADGLKRYRDHDGRGPAQGGFKVCWAADEAEARRTAHRLWPNEALPGELAQILPSPRHFEQASEIVTEDMVAEQVPCGPDPEPVVAKIREFLDAGFDEVYVNQIGPDQ